MTYAAADVALIAADLERATGWKVEGVRTIAVGHSGFTYFVDLPGRTAVLRLPPPGTRFVGHADVPRQGRIMAALGRQGQPVPGVLAISDEPLVDGRPFCLVEAVDGQRVEEVHGKVADLDLVRAAVGVLKRLQAVPLDRTGIGEEEPMGLADELERFGRLMDRAPAELTGQGAELATVLRRWQPDARPPVLVHGDYQLGNLLFRGSEVVAILDWEIAHIGQALIDLAGLAIVCRAVPEGEFGVPGAGTVHVSIAEIMAAYEERVDRSELAWYVGLAAFKYASILGYNLSLHRKGRRHDPIYETLTRYIPDLIAFGVTVASGGGAQL